MRRMPFLVVGGALGLLGVALGIAVNRAWGFDLDPKTEVEAVHLLTCIAVVLGTALTGAVLLTVGLAIRGEK